MSELQQFHWADYLVFALTLAVAAAIGIYHACTGKKQSSTEEFLLGGRNLRIVPVALSVQASFLSGIAILGWPAEFYFYGWMAFLIVIGQVLGLLATAHVFVPIIRKMSMSSVFEYIERRYNKTVRVMASITFSLMMLMYMAVVLYTPALAFSQVTALSLWGSILAVGLICTFYTTIGGIKAVVWTDTFQMVIILVGVLALFIRGVVKLGGFGVIWETAQNGSRLGPIDWSPHPHTRHTFWTQSIGAAFMVMSLFAVNQASVQRYMGMKNTRAAQTSVYIVMFGSVLQFILLGLLGMTIYAWYVNCDPIAYGTIQQGDQLVILYMMDVLGDLHGFPGLFTAATFSGALSTVSSGVNSMAAVMLEDITQPAYKKIKGVPMEDKFATFVSKIYALSFGLLTIVLAYLFSLAGQGILSVALSLFGMVGGPMLGLFSLAIFFRCSNSIGAGVGLLSGLGMTMLAGIGAIVHPGGVVILPLSTDECPAGNYTTPEYTTIHTTTNQMTTELIIDSGNPGIHEYYHMSYMWYTLWGCVVTLIVGLFVSVLTGCNEEEVDPDLMFNPSCTSCKKGSSTLMDKAGESVASCAGKKFSYSAKDLPSAHLYMHEVTKEDPPYTNTTYTNGTANAGYI